MTAHRNEFLTTSTKLWLWLAKCISVSANYGISWLIVTRRASEVSTQIFEHCTTKVFCQSNQPNDMRKLKTILDWRDVEKVRKLKVGEFIVQTPEKTAFLTTEKYTDSDPEPVSYIPARPFSEFKAKIKGFWRRIKSWFRSGTKNKKGV